MYVDLRLVIHIIAYSWLFNVEHCSIELTPVTERDDMSVVAGLYKKRAWRGGHEASGEHGYLC